MIFFSIANIPSGEYQLIYSSSQSGESVITLQEFSTKGQHEQEFPSESGVTFRVQLTVEADKTPEKAIVRSPSMQFLKDKLSKFFSKDESDSDNPHTTKRASSIRHSRSHHTNLNEIADEIEQDPPKAMKLTRTTSEVTGGEATARSSQNSRERTRRNRRKDQKGDSSETKNEDPIDEIKPKSKKREKSSVHHIESQSAPVIAESPSKSRRNKPQGVKPTDSPHRERRRKGSAQLDADGTKLKSNEARERKSRAKTKVISQETIDIPEPVKNEPEDTAASETSTEPTGNPLGGRRRTVVLQPLGGDNQTCKIFGSPLSAVMEAQKTIHPDIDIPIFFIRAGRVIRERGLIKFMFHGRPFFLDSYSF
jgi:hypothetical protein